MNLKLFILPTLLLASCAAQPKYKDITLEGAEADAVFQEWSSALPPEMAYPVDFRFDLDFSLSGIPEFGDAEMKFLIGADATMASAWDYRMISDWSTAAMGQEMGVQLGVSSDPEKMRISLNNAEMLEMMLGTTFPSGVSISTDRAHSVWDVINHLAQVSMEAAGEYEGFSGWTDSITGFGDIGHPMLNSRYMSMSPMLQVNRWQVEGGMVKVDFALDREMFIAMLAAPELAEIGFDSGTADAIAYSMVTTASFDVKDGSMTNMLIKAVIPIVDEFGSETPIDFSMTMTYSELLEPVAPVEFSDPETAMDLNMYFDQYWPKVEAMMPMIEEQMLLQMESQSGDDGGDFEF